MNPRASRFERGRESMPTIRRRTSWTDVCFLASVAAAAVHFGAVHSHIAYAPAAAFMLAAGCAQLAWALAAARGARASLLRAAMFGNACVVMLWLLSRTYGLPFGMNPGMREHVHSPDALATALEVLVIVACRMRLRGNRAAAPSGALVRLTFAATALAAFVTSHEPSRERLAGIATLALAFVARASIDQLAVLRRNHAQISVRRCPVRLGVGVYAGRGARGHATAA
jgi:hypothetical protein